MDFNSAKERVDHDKLYNLGEVRFDGIGTGWDRVEVGRAGAHVTGWEK